MNLLTRKMLTCVLLSVAIFPELASSQMSCELVFDNGEVNASASFSRPRIQLSQNDAFLTSSEIDYAHPDARLTFAEGWQPVSNIHNSAISEMLAKLAKSAAGENPVGAIALSISPMANGNWIIVARGAPKEWTSKIADLMKLHPELMQLLTNAIGGRPHAEVLARFDMQGQIQLNVSQKAQLSRFIPTLAMAPHQLNPAPFIFQGKNAYPAFERTLKAVRGTWDQRFPMTEFSKVGTENQFGTLIENASQLIGRRVAGVSVHIRRILAAPLDTATILEFTGEVMSVTNTNATGIDPIWSAEIKTPNGVVKINLTEARGLRVLKSNAIDDSSLSGNEKEAAMARRKEIYRDFVARESSPLPIPMVETQHERLQARLNALSPEIRASFETYRERISKILSGSPSADVPTGVKFLKRSADDMTLRPLPKMKDESLRPMIEEAQRVLYETDGPHGFNNFLTDFALEIYLDAMNRNELSTGDHSFSIRNPHDNYPFSEGMQGMSSETHTLHAFPSIKESDLMEAIDRRIHLYGFDEGIKNVPGLHFVPGSKYLATLHGMSLDETTSFFKLYSSENLLFQDTYFIGKPHGQYSHIFQWLYLAERLSHAEMNSMHANLLKPFMHMQPYFMDDFATGVRVTDFVGQRAPQNPDHINSMLQILFPIH